MNHHRVRIPGPPSNRSIVLPRGWLAVPPLPFAQGSPAYNNFVSTLPLFDELAEYAKDTLCQAKGGPADPPYPMDPFECTRLAHDDRTHLATVNDPGGKAAGRVVAVWVDPS